VKRTESTLYPKTVLLVYCGNCLTSCSLSAEVQGAGRLCSACEACHLCSVVPGSYIGSMQKQSPILHFLAYPRGTLSGPVSWLVIPLSALAGEALLTLSLVCEVDYGGINGFSGLCVHGNEPSVS